MTNPPYTRFDNSSLGGDSSHEKFLRRKLLGT